MILVLCGPKHCGKTSVAAYLHKFIFVDVDFVDTDDLIEKQTGKSVREIYKEGADIFKEAETYALGSALALAESKGDNLIVATGGGIADNEQAIAILRGKADIKLVYLDVSYETAFKRIMLDAGVDGVLPPFLQSAEPSKTHKELHERRAALYKKYADLTINTEGKTVKEIAEAIKASATHGAPFIYI
ncbi:MAG: shikimate kinase [Termitinemataceae bacterium]|nr:MAG: shikimate kinase [Termitinemataceae bacterium]